MSTTPALEMHDVRVRRGEVLALDGIDLTVQRGTVCGLIGGNGSGKSTLLATTVGALPPETGTVTVLGREVEEARRAGSIAYMPQYDAADRHFPLGVREIVATGLYGHLGPRRRLRPEHHRIIDAALMRVELEHLAHRRIGELSGGQRKRAFLARSLVQDAELFLLDEPFAGVDLPTERRLMRVLRELRAEGRTLVVATHGLAHLESLCDEVVLLQRRVVAAGAVADVTRPEVLARALLGDAA